MAATARSKDGGSGSRITIHDLAAMAGVTASTVSRAINARGGVGAATRQRILDLAAEHDFTLNATAQRLSTGRVQAIGVAFPFHASEFVMRPVYPGLLGGLGDGAEQAGYDLMLLSVPSVQHLSRLTAAINRRRVDGIVLPAAGRDDPSLRELARLGFPTVVIGHRGRAGNIPWVDSSHDQASADLTRIMISGGRRRLAMLNGPPEVSACALRARGFWTAVAEAGDAVDHAEEHSVGFEPVAIRAGVARLLSRPERQRPTAIVGANDAIASACLEQAREMGLEVPHDLAISGFDNRSFSAYTSPPLTTVSMPLHDMGIAAAGMLVSLIEGRPLTRKRVILPAALVLRESTPPVHSDGSNESLSSSS
jgi:LacI family transcriptional regulator